MQAVVFMARNLAPLPDVLSAELDAVSGLLATTGMLQQSRDRVDQVARRFGSFVFRAHGLCSLAEVEPPVAAAFVR
ncbi:MAG: hypothetical protein ACKOA9_07435, partial [Actinomycetota bacterium]